MGILHDLVVDLNAAKTTSEVEHTLQKISAVTDDEINDDVRAANDIFYNCASFCQRYIDNAKFRYVVPVLELIHRANKNDEWLMSMSSIIFPKLHPFYSSIIAAADPDSARHASGSGSTSSAAAYVMSAKLRRDADALAALTNILVLVTDMCDIDSPEQTIRTLKRFVHIALYVLVVCGGTVSGENAQGSDCYRRRASVKLSPTAYAMDTLLRQAGFVISNILVSFNRLAYVVEKSMTKYLTPVFNLVGSPVELSVQRSVVITLKVLYDYNCDAHANAPSTQESQSPESLGSPGPRPRAALLSERIVTLMEGSPSWTERTIEAFRTTHADDIGDLPQLLNKEVLMPLFSVADMLENHCFNTLSCKVQVSYPVENGRKKRALFKEAYVDWNTASIVTHFRDSDTQYWPLFPLNQFDWRPRTRDFFLKFRAWNEHEDSQYYLADQQQSVHFQHPAVDLVIRFHAVIDPYVRQTIQNHLNDVLLKTGGHDSSSSSSALSLPLCAGAGKIDNEDHQVKGKDDSKNDTQGAMDRLTNISSNDVIGKKQVSQSDRLKAFHRRITTERSSMVSMEEGSASEPRRKKQQADEQGDGSAAKGHEEGGRYKKGNDRNGVDILSSRLGFDKKGDDEEDDKDTDRNGKKGEKEHSGMELDKSGTVESPEDDFDIDVDDEFEEDKVGKKSGEPSGDERDGDGDRGKAGRGKGSENGSGSGNGPGSGGGNGAGKDDVDMDMRMDEDMDMDMDTEGEMDIDMDIDMDDDMGTETETEMEKSKETKNGGKAAKNARHGALKVTRTGRGVKKTKMFESAMKDKCGRAKYKELLAKHIDDEGGVGDDDDSDSDDGFDAGLDAGKEEDDGGEDENFDLDRGLDGGNVGVGQDERSLRRDDGNDREYDGDNEVEGLEEEVRKEGEVNIEEETDDDEEEKAESDTEWLIEDERDESDDEGHDDDGEEVKAAKNRGTSARRGRSGSASPVPGGRRRGGAGGAEKKSECGNSGKKQRDKQKGKKKGKKGRCEDLEESEADGGCAGEEGEDDGEGGEGDAGGEEQGGGEKCGEIQYDLLAEKMAELMCGIDKWRQKDWKESETVWTSTIEGVRAQADEEKRAAVHEAEAKLREVEKGWQGVVRGREAELGALRGLEGELRKLEEGVVGREGAVGRLEDELGRLAGRMDAAADRDEEELGEALERLVKQCDQAQADERARCQRMYEQMAQMMSMSM